jgi:uncharacterized cofD-like protein
MFAVVTSKVDNHATVPRVTTIGGGHGQAVILQALRDLRCSITAIVATADDGGCSGEIRREYGMPAPGDLRRCLSALALDSELANLQEERMPGINGVPRCRGNLVIGKRYLEHRSLQQAADWVAAGLGCVGRVMPASEEPGTFVVCDRKHGLVEGELNVERTVASPLVATVTGAYRPNIDAIQAIDEADAVIMGPGSFYTSTLSAVVTGEVGAAVCRSSGRRLLILNLANGRLCTGYRDSDYTVVLASHLTICSRGETPDFALLRHAKFDCEERLEDGTLVYCANVAADDGIHHSAPRLAVALGKILGLSKRIAPEVPVVRAADTQRAELLHALTTAHELRVDPLGASKRQTSTK